MDYEKKYNEALERAKNLYPGVHEHNKKMLEQIFPELRESEDEKIRKTLVEYFGPQAQLDFIRGVPIQKIRDWLEKQKESLHISESCKENAEYFTSQCGDNRFEIIDKAKRDIIAKTNIESSPDEMKVLDSFLFRAWQMGWLGKYDVIVPEQKPAWNEEDERRIDAICELLENTSAIHPNYSHRKLIIWLKDLRPSWKPSEEHLSALLAVFNDPNNIGSQTCQLALTDLYEQLKKL